VDTARDLNRRLGRTLRGHRLAHGSSLSELARASGLSKTIVGRIESGDGNPSIETLWRISQALALPLGALLEDEGRPNARVIRARSGEQVRAESGMTGWLVHADGRDHRTELYDLEYPKGTDHRGDAHLPGTEEVIVCVHGRIRVGPAGEEAELGPGDAILFAADAPHSYEALHDTRVLCWMLYAPGT
jgi:XRE family transcriptional regulator, regulator of sulfur utilization